MKKSLIIGKFYPPHNGHHYLIDTAMNESDDVLVLLCYSDVESIDPHDRMAWLRDRHPGLRIQLVRDNHPYDESDEGWARHMRLWCEAIKDRHFWPTHVYSSEQYGDELARRLSDPELIKWLEFPDLADWVERKQRRVEHRPVDIRRKQVPVSATQVRADMAGNWDFLAPGTRAALVKRVVVCGAESTGTTTLAKALANHYKTTVVPEYGRHFDWAVGKHHEWKPEDFWHIAHEQGRWEDNLARESHNGLLICDTDEFATAMFHEVYLGRSDASLGALARATPADLYIITDHEGVPFEDDGTRLNSGRREWMTDWFTDHLPPDLTVGVYGSHEERMRWATTYIDDVMKDAFKFAHPLDYEAAPA
jgi:HTH-type transcriptional repressor of NAD biosynthesis genes